MSLNLSVGRRYNMVSFLSRAVAGARDMDLPSLPSHVTRHRQHRRGIHAPPLSQSERVRISCSSESPSAPQRHRGTYLSSSRMWGRDGAQEPGVACCLLPLAGRDMVSLSSFFAAIMRINLATSPSSLGDTPPHTTCVLPKRPGLPPDHRITPSTATTPQPGSSARECRILVAFPRPGHHLRSHPGLSLSPSCDNPWLGPQQSILRLPSACSTVAVAPKGCTELRPRGRLLSPSRPLYYTHSCRLRLPRPRRASSVFDLGCPAETAVHSFASSQHRPHGERSAMSLPSQTKSTPPTKRPR